MVFAAQHHVASCLRTWCPAYSFISSSVSVNRRCGRSVTRNVHLLICGTMRELVEYASRLRPDRTNYWVMSRSVHLVDVDTRESRLIEGWGAWALGNARRVPTLVEELLGSLPPPVSGSLPDCSSAPPEEQ